MTNCQRRFFSSAIFFRKIQKVRQFILGLKGEILILAKMELPFRFLEPPRPDGAKNRISRGSKTRLLKFPHYLFDFSLGPGPRTFLPIKKTLFFYGGERKIRKKKNRPLREKCRKNTRCPLPFRLRRRPSVAPFRAGNAGPRGILARPVGRHRENAPRSWKAFFPRHRV